MKLTLDTARDNPRLIRAAIAMVLTALDNGDALPAAVPAGLIQTDNEAANVGFGMGTPAAPLANPPAASAPPPPPPVSSSAGVSGMPPPPAPSGTPAPPPAPANVSERDSEGLPWDSRIHSGSHAKIANGTWKLAKGMSLQQAKVDAVKAELRNLMALPVPPAPPPVEQQQVASAVDPATFPEFMTWIAGMIQAGKWTHQQTAQALGTLGLQNAAGLSARPDLIPPAVNVIRSMLPA